MSLVLAVRGGSLDAVYSNGGKTGYSTGVGFAVTADGTAISGSALVAPANNTAKRVLRFQSICA